MNQSAKHNNSNVVLVNSLSQLKSAASNPSSNSNSNSNNNNNNNNNNQLPFPPIPTKLVLHLDINETILLGDNAGGDSRHDSIQKMLAKSAFCQIPYSALMRHSQVIEALGPAVALSTAQCHQRLLPFLHLAEPTHWWDGQPMDMEPSSTTSPPSPPPPYSPPPLYTGWEWPPGCCPYYRTAYKRYSKRFVDHHHGKIYRPILQACEQALHQADHVHNTTTNNNNNNNNNNNASNHQPGSDNHILPAFYQTLQYLIQNASQQPFQIVFRTFGSDLEQIADILTNFAMGNHPQYPNIHYPPLQFDKQTCLYQGRWKIVTSSQDNNPNHDDNDDDNDQDDNPNIGSTTATTTTTTTTTMIYQLWNPQETILMAQGEEQILQLLSKHTVCGIRDDYPFWKKHDWNPMAGKPIWLPTTSVHDQCSTQSPMVHHHHLFFDDNIHNLHFDGIACLRQQQPQQQPQNGPQTITSTTTSSTATSSTTTSVFKTVNVVTMHERYQGVHLIRVPTVEPVLNPQWFIQQIQQAQERFQWLLQEKTEQQNKTSKHTSKMKKEIIS